MDEATIKSMAAELAKGLKTPEDLNQMKLHSILNFQTISVMKSISPRKAQIAVMGLVLKPLQLKMDNWL